MAFAGASPKHLLRKAQKSSPSPPARGGEGWGEEGRSSCGWPVRQRLDAPLPDPLPARSSRGEGVGAVAYPAASSVRGSTDTVHSLFCWCCFLLRPLSLTSWPASVWPWPTGDSLSG